MGMWRLFLILLPLSNIAQGPGAGYGNYRVVCANGLPNSTAYIVVALILMHTMVLAKLILSKAQDL